MSDDRGFDPRYDPAFQRGWEGGEEPAAPARLSGLVPSAPSRAPAEPAEPARIVVTAEAGAEEAEEPRGGINPFVVVLAVVSAVLVAAGLWMASRVSDGYASTGPSTQVDYAMLQVLLIGAPVTVLLGVATAVGLLFLFAVRWRR